MNRNNIFDLKPKDTDWFSFENIYSIFPKSVFQFSCLYILFNSNTVISRIPSWGLLYFLNHGCGQGQTGASEVFFKQPCIKRFSKTVFWTDLNKSPLTLTSFLFNTGPDSWPDNREGVILRSWQELWESFFLHLQGRHHPPLDLPLFYGRQRLSKICSSISNIAIRLYISYWKLYNGRMSVW